MFRRDFVVRLNRFLSQCGLGSRRGCEQIILDGRVVINGKTVTELGTLVKPEDAVSVDGKPIRTESPIVIALHKPKGYICSRSDERDRMTIYALLPRQFQSLHHVGRLDKESEGLLLMTNRGDLSHHLIHPSKGAEKEYEVIVDNPLDQAVMAKLVKGMMTEEGHAKAERAWMITEYRCHVVLKQGLKRQIRLMFYQLGFEVERLTRTRIGWLELKGLPKGSWKELSETEIQRFFSEAGTTGRNKPAGDKRVSEGSGPAKKTSGGWDDETDSPSPVRPASKRPGKPAFRAGGKTKPTGRARYSRPPERSFGEGQNSGPARGRPRSDGPRRSLGEERSESSDHFGGSSRRRSGGSRSGPPGRSRSDDGFSSESRPPRRPRSDDGFSGESRPPRRSGPSGRSGPPKRDGGGSPRKPGGQGPRRRF
jgi:23S rRNA pseudouridine2605 synthase